MVDSGPRQLIALLVALGLAVLAAVELLGGGEAKPAAAPLALDGAPASGDGTSGAPGPAGDPGRGGAEDLYVHVAGAVRRPGLYRVPPGARAGAAVERAGGTRRSANLAGVNLAATLQDGQQIVVPGRDGTSPATPAAAASGPGASTEAGAPTISLASATVEELDAAVEGIGPTLAARIIEFRDAEGPIASLDELRELPGIGEVRFESLRAALTP